MPQQLTCSSFCSFQVIDLLVMGTKSIMPSCFYFLPLPAAGVWDASQPHRNASSLATFVCVCIHFCLYLCIGSEERIVEHLSFPHTVKAFWKAFLHHFSVATLRCQIKCSPVPWSEVGVLYLWWCSKIHLKLAYLLSQNTYRTSE